MSTIEITRVEDVRAGDMATLAYEGHAFTGRVWEDDGGPRVGGSYLSSPYVTLLGATREVPDLPTEPGSVIVNATIRGTEGVTAFLSASAWEPDVYRWISGDRIEGTREHDRANITAWTPARIVPEDGAS